MKHEKIEPSKTRRHYFKFTKTEVERILICHLESSGKLNFASGLINDYQLQSCGEMPGIPSASSLEEEREILELYAEEKGE
tara:strand:- start:137 stop:379 length:243 start_codon:yes stop_codon:yes gene_type:complete